MVIKEPEGTRFVENITYSQREINERNDFIQECIMAGEPFSDIGYAVGLSRERIRQLANDWGLYETWEDNNAEVVWQRSPSTLRKIRKDALEDVVQGLTNRMLHRARQESKACEKTVQAFLRTTSDHTFDEYFKLFKAYYDAQARGEKFSLEKLEEISGFEFSSISYLFKNLGMTPMHRTFKARPVTTNEKSAIERAFHVPMSTTDVAYFCGVRDHVVEVRFWRRNEKRPEHEVSIKSFGKGNRLTYRLASQIYEAKDLGFNIEEIGGLFGVKLELIDFALMSRGAISPDIVKAMETIYPKERFERPYLTQEQKQRLHKNV